MSNQLNLTPIQHQVLDHIAAGESHGYTEVYGGHNFKSFSDHPRVQIPIGDGHVTTAAGRYQITAPTWDGQKKRLGLTDFSPASQDAAAWDLAQRTYFQRTGRSLENDAATGRANYSVLGNQWTSLAGERPGVMTSGPGATQLGRAATLPPPAQPSNPLQLIDMNAPLPPAQALGALQALVPNHKLTPVDHNPWTPAAPYLTPVDYDPFQAKENSDAPAG